MGVVVTPSNGYGGNGVTRHVRTNWRLLHAVARASLYDRRILVEDQVYDECLLALVCRGEVLSVKRVLGMRVVGIWTSALRDLAAGKLDWNDADSRFCLDRLSMDPESIVPEGTSVLIRCVGKTFRQGFEPRSIYYTNVIQQLGREVSETFRHCAALAGSELAGPDVNPPAITKPLEVVRDVVKQVDTTPALHHNCDRGTTLARAVRTRSLKYLRINPPGFFADVALANYFCKVPGLSRL